MMKLLKTVCILGLLTIQTAQANVEIGFYESAPKDRFEIKNTGSCLMEALTVEIDLAKSAGRLIFDTTSTGAGVEVFQPFEVTKGNITLASEVQVKDGDSKLTLNIPSLASGSFVSFTIDVDDTLPASELGQIRVSSSEIKDGIVSISLEGKTPVSSKFGSNNKAIIQGICS